jgi:hypothetical protein
MRDWIHTNTRKEMITPSQVLEKALGFIDAPEKWIQKQGRSEDRKRFCMIVAVSEAVVGLDDYTRLYSAATYCLGTAVSEISPHKSFDIVDFNDDEKTTHSWVVAAMKRAIEIAKERENLGHLPIPN